MTNTKRVTALRRFIEEFLAERLETKLKALPIGDQKRQKLAEEYQRGNWLDSAAQRAGTLSVVTHTIKGVHPSAKGSSWNATMQTMPSRQEVGTHSLSRPDLDVTGPANAMDVNKFLALQLDGVSLLDLLIAGDSDMLAAMSDDHAVASQWRKGFCQIVEGPVKPSSHTLAKQVFWPACASFNEFNVAHDQQYHLLLPLHASSVSHCLYQRIQSHRYGDEYKEARKAKREGLPHPTGYHTYPLLAVEIKGGTKPQNVSLLNQKQSGINYLLAALPPRWDTNATTPLLDNQEALKRFGSQRDVARLLRQFRNFLNSRTEFHTNAATKQRRKEFIAALIEALVVFGASYANELAPGWTTHTRCLLDEVEQCWLDPYRAQEDEEFRLRYMETDWAGQLTARVVEWITKQLESDLLVFEDEERQYLMRELKTDMGWSGLLKSKPLRKQIAKSEKDQQA